MYITLSMIQSTMRKKQTTTGTSSTRLTKTDSSRTDTGSSPSSRNWKHVLNAQRNRVSNIKTWWRQWCWNGKSSFWTPFPLPAIVTLVEVLYSVTVVRSTGTPSVEKLSLEFCRIDSGVIWKGFISLVYMPNMNFLSLTFQNLWPSLKF